MVRLQAKVIYCANYISVEKDLNKALDELKDHKIRDVKLDTDWTDQEDHYMILILYEA
jgi:hypothetical protein